MCDSKIEIKVGDNVVIVLPRSKHFGKTGTIISPGQHRLIPGEYVVRIAGTGKTNWVYTKNELKKLDLRREDIKVGDKVTPVCPGGLCLSATPFTSEYIQREYNTHIVLRGVGTVLERNSIIIDYDTWPDGYVGLGKIDYVSFLVKCKDGVGWAGEGALMLAC